MKTINVIFNHNIFDAPYNQNEVKKIEKTILDALGNDVNLLYSFSSNSHPNPFIYDLDFVCIEHSIPLTLGEKKTLAEIIKKGLTKLKSESPIDAIITFRKIENDDLFYFPAE